MSETINKQREYDTLLIAGWRHAWIFKRISDECAKRGIDLEAIDRRAFSENYRSKLQVRAVIASTCEKMSNHLWACKQNADFITVRNNLNAGAYKFSGECLMISRNEQNKHKGDMRRIKESRETYEASYEGDRKLGGICRGKHAGGRQ